MSRFPVPDLSRRALRQRSVGAEVDTALEFITECLWEACALVAEDCGRERYDDRTSEGFLRWRRGRNIIIERVAEEGPDGVRALDRENALQIEAGEYLISFYSARDGVGQPDLSGGSRTKRAVVDEMQIQIEGLSNGDGPRRLALLYEADHLGLRLAAIGVLSSAHDWHWWATLYRRDDARADKFNGAATAPMPRHPSYDAQPVPELPALRPRKERKETGRQHTTDGE